MNNRHVFWVAIAAGAWLLWGGVSQRKTESRGAPRHASEPAASACPGLPTDTTPIAGLQTAWAISDPASAGIRLVLADHAVECRNLDPLGSRIDPYSCTTEWQFAFTLSPDSQKPGTYNLHDYEADYAERISIATPGAGCGTGPQCMGGARGAAGGAKGPDSTIEIYSVTEECVTGRIVRLERGMSNPDFDFTGTFQAVMCKPSAR